MERKEKILFILSSCSGFVLVIGIALIAAYYPKADDPYTEHQKELNELSKEVERLQKEVTDYEKKLLQNAIDVHTMDNDKLDSLFTILTR